MAEYSFSFKEVIDQLAAGTNRTIHFHLRLTHDEFITLRERATELDMNLQEYMLAKLFETREETE